MSKQQPLPVTLLSSRRPPYFLPVRGGGGTASVWKGALLWRKIVFCYTYGKYDAVAEAYMKTIGLIGGMSWESTVTYYRIINETVKTRLGGLHSAKLLLYSVDFAELETCLQTGDWQTITEKLTEAALTLQKGGADFILVGTNTMHKVVPHVQSRVAVPIIHIADATAEAIKVRNLTTAGLLGTRFTMSQDFIKTRIAQRGIGVVVPDGTDSAYIDRVIFDELCRGVVSRQSKNGYLAIIDKLAAQGADCVILGCTEIGLLVSQNDTSLPVFDTTLIHAEKAVELALET